MIVRIFLFPFYKDKEIIDKKIKKKESKSLGEISTLKMDITSSFTFLEAQVLLFNISHNFCISFV